VKLSRLKRHLVELPPPTYAGRLGVKVYPAERAWEELVGASPADLSGKTCVEGALGRARPGTAWCVIWVKLAGKGSWIEVCGRMVGA
jgi:hypothetical protein